jgi:alkylation response protein AidB-like acyl-CoA dehydrogenase
MTEQTKAQAISREELSEFLDVAANFAEAVPGHDWAELDTGNEAAITKSWDGIREIGFDRCLVSEEGGGAGLGASALAALVEEIAAGEGGVAMLMLLANIAAAALPPALLSETGQEARLAYVPAVGSRGREDLAVKLSGGELTGNAPFVLGGYAADGFVVACDDGDGPALAFVAADAPGVTVRQIDDQLALGAARAAQLIFSGTSATRLGGADELARADALLSSGTAAIARGTARRARRLAQEYAENRYQGGTEIINHGAVRDMLARMSERELGMPQPAAESAGGALAVGLAGKIAITDAAVESTLDAIQVFGGMGYMRETGVEKLMRDAKYCQIYPRPNWAMRDDLLELQR